MSIVNCDEFPRDSKDKKFKMVNMHTRLDDNISRIFYLNLKKLELTSHKSCKITQFLNLPYAFVYC